MKPKAGGRLVFPRLPMGRWSTDRFPSRSAYCGPSWNHL